MTTPIVQSALWAAWGDALGFQTELTSKPAQVQRRLGVEIAETTVAWHRRVGGRFGVQVELPAGTYSDDTQLRLAVSRCIRATGRFDVEAFSKIELPVFLSYGLGVGLGTRTAALALEKRSTRWSANFFETKRSKYVDAGGNGAAMRIQPHVWSAPDFRPMSYLPAVIRDSITTHGHPRGILGACLHALALGSTLRDSAVPTPNRWAGMADYLLRVPDLVKSDDVLAETWLPRWEAAAGSWAEAVQRTVQELRHQLSTAVEMLPTTDEPDYATLAKSLGALEPQTRGSGTIASVLSLWLAWVFRDRPADGIRATANLIGSDTDTVATMAGALLGAVTKARVPGPLLDHELHVEEAQRVERLRLGRAVDDFPHPDPLHWHPPKTQLDSVGLMGEDLGVAGLGRASEIGPIHTDSKKRSGYQWLKLSFGQHVLAKRRTELHALDVFAQPRQRDTKRAQQALNLLVETPHERVPSRSSQLDATLEGHIEQAINSNFDPILIARTIADLATQPHGPTRAGLFAAAIAEELRSGQSRAPRLPRTSGARR